jgi:dTDP-4-dehydrorhamnose reductase
MKKQRLLILGATGMLGSTLIRWFQQHSEYEVFGSCRNETLTAMLQKEAPNAIFFKDIDVDSLDSLSSLFSSVKPHVVINCIGIVKQLNISDDPLVAIPINSILPHRLARLAQFTNTRLVHMSTDCVFSGKKGHYSEDDVPDASDLYGKSKLLGEVDYPNAITLRTSIIGHELFGARSLISWFLAQSDTVKGYKNAVFSGLPTVEIARIICNFVIPNPHLRGLYHLSSDPISKFDLLSLVAKTYKKSLDLVSDEDFVINRSLNSDRFRSSTGFMPESWDVMVKKMHEFH